MTIERYTYAVRPITPDSERYAPAVRAITPARDYDAPLTSPLIFFTKSNLSFYDTKETKGAGTHNIGFAGSSRERER